MRDATRCDRQLLGVEKRPSVQQQQPPRCPGRRRPPPPPPPPAATSTVAEAAAGTRNQKSWGWTWPRCRRDAGGGDGDDDDGRRPAWRVPRLTSTCSRTRRRRPSTDRWAASTARARRSRTCTRSACRAPWSWCSCRSSSAVRGSACRSSCSACSCARPSVEQPRPGQSSWTRPTCPPTLCTTRCWRPTTVPAETATAGSDRCLTTLTRHHPTREPTWRMNLLQGQYCDWYDISHTGLPLKLKGKNRSGRAMDLLQMEAAICCSLCILHTQWTVKLKTVQLVQCEQQQDCFT